MYILGIVPVCETVLALGFYIMLLIYVYPGLNHIHISWLWFLFWCLVLIRFRCGRFLRQARCARGCALACVLDQGLAVARADRSGQRLPG